MSCCGRRDGGAAGGGPVLRLRVVEAELDALLAALFGEFFEGIALEGRGVDDVEGIGLGVEHGEAVVVFGGDDDVLHAGGLGERDDVVGVEAGGIELAGEVPCSRRREWCASFMIHSPMRGSLAVPLPAGME